jgi:hypothetical protein
LGRDVAPERLQQENVALREEIDKASMFEEIVGTSVALQAVISGRSLRRDHRRLRGGSLWDTTK